MLRLRVLGAFEVEGVAAHDLGTRKGRTLLKALALARGRPVSVDHLVECLWPSGPPARPGVQVAVLVSRLRGVLGPDRLERSDAGYALRADWLDLDALEGLAAEAARRLDIGGFALARAAAHAGLALVRGPLLAEEADAPWVDVERSAAERLARGVRRTAARAALAAGDPDGAGEHAAVLLDADPYDEEALRTLMAAHATAGRPASALAAYAASRARLGEDLGVGPGPATEALHTAILRSEALPGLVVGPPVRLGFAATAGKGDGRGAAALVGRGEQLAALDAALGRVGAGRMGAGRMGAGRMGAGGMEVVAVTGDAGIGKTCLVAAFSERAAAAGAEVLSARCDVLDRALPLQVVATALAGYLRSAGPGPAAALLGPEAPVLAPLLGTPGEAEGRQPVALPGDAGAARVVLFNALVAVLRRVAAAPLVLVFDDLHLAGASTLDWIHFAAARHLPALVVVVYRSGEGPPLPVGATSVVVPPLDRAGAAELVGDERATALHVRSGGNPLFLVELAAAEPGDELPDSIRHAVAERCDRAGAAAATLRAAAVIGSEVDLDLLAAVLAVAPVDLLDHLEDGARLGFLVESEAGFAFRHVLVQEALSAGVGVSRRALLHREAGRALARRPRPEPLAVAYHARLGGDQERAAAALVDAARLASERHDQADAEQRLDQALALADRPEFRLERARVRILRNDFAGAGDDARVALRQGAGPAALEVAGWAAYHARDLAAARRLADDGARLAADPQLRASCLSLAGQVRTVSGDLEEAEARLEEAMRLARGRSLVVAEGCLGTLRVYQGRPGPALELLRPVADAGAPSGLFGLRTLGMVGYALALLGRPAEALDTYAGLEAVMVERGNERYQGFVENSRGWILRNVGAPGEADEANQRGLDAAGRIAAAEPLGATEQRIHGLLDLAAGRLQAGEWDAARAYLAAVEPLQRVEHSLRWRHALRARLLSARLCLAEGATEAARAEAAELAREAERLGVARYRSVALLVEAQARARAGEHLDPGDIAAFVEGLPAVAGLEAWWLTAEAAAAFGVDAWWRLAEERVDVLAGQAGERAEGLRRYAGVRLERMRTTGTNG